MAFKIVSELINPLLYRFLTLRETAEKLCLPKHRIYFIPENHMYYFSRIDKEQDNIYTLIPRKHKPRNSRSN